MRIRTYSLLMIYALLCLFCTPSDSQTHEYDWASLDEESFESFQPTDEIMETIGITAGMKVGEVGAGGGRVAVRVAKIVGPSGKVYANDITESALEYMRQRCKKDKIDNMEIIEGTLTDPKFPSETMDVVYLTNTYRHLDKPFEVLSNIRSSLKPTGKLAIIDMKRYKQETDGKDGDVSNSLIQNAERAGYSLVNLATFLLRDDIYIFQKSETF